MELGPIFRSLLRSRTRFALIIIEVALTLAIVTNCVNMLMETGKEMNSATGLDEHNIVAVNVQPFSPELRDRTVLENLQEADLQALRSLPGVTHVARLGSHPFSSSGSWSQLVPVDSKRAPVHGNTLWSGAGVVAALGGKMLEGRDLVESDLPPNDRALDSQPPPVSNVVVTKPFADRLFPDGQALGKLFRYQLDIPSTFRIVGIAESMHGCFPHWPYINQVIFCPIRTGSFDYGMNYVARCRAGEIRNVLPLVEKRLLAVNAGRTLGVWPLSEVRKAAYFGDLALIRLLAWLIFLVSFVTSLGVIGVTSFAVAERKRQIGTRRAVGACRLDILRYFLTENWVTTTLGVSLGVVLAYLLNYLLVTRIGGTPLDWELMAVGIAFLWAVGLVSTLFPALRATRVPPVVATRTI